VSRTRIGLFSPCSMMAEILITSMNVTDKVRISVPKGSPKRTVRCSAWRTTDRAEPRITLNSQRNVAFRTSGLARAESSASPTTEKTAQVRRVTERNQSERQLVGLSVVFAAFNKRVYASCPAPVPQSVGKGEHEETMPNYTLTCARLRCSRYGTWFGWNCAPRDAEQAPSCASSHRLRSRPPP
jgi:hypothetical protein